jgi:signal transduction histidine kinase
MQGFSSLLLENYSPSLDEAGKDFLRRLAVSATRMDNLIQDLLEYGKLSHVSLPATWVKLDAALETVLASLAEEIALKNATITVQKNLPRIWANGALLEQILTHIVSNALKYVAPGIDPKVRIWEEEEEASCTILVQDNGIGIEPDQHERIFHIFQRLYNENYCPGTGMGLAIVQKGVQRLGGRVRVESAPGRGSCFSIALPKPLCQCERRVGEVARRDSANNLEMATQE